MMLYYDDIPLFTRSNALLKAVSTTIRVGNTALTTIFKLHFQVLKHAVHTTCADHNYQIYLNECPRDLPFQLQFNVGFFEIDCSSEPVSPLIYPESTILLQYQCCAKGYVLDCL